METIYIPDSEFVIYIKNLQAEGKAELVNVDGFNRWVCEVDGEGSVRKIVRPESSKPDEQ